MAKSKHAAVKPLASVAERLYGPVELGTPDHAAFVQTLLLQRDAALKTLQSRANLVQTVETVDQLALTLERAVADLGRGVKLLQQLLGLTAETSLVEAARSVRKRGSHVVTARRLHGRPSGRKGR